MPPLPGDFAGITTPTKNQPQVPAPFANLQVPCNAASSGVESGHQRRARQSTGEEGFRGRLILHKCCLLFWAFPDCPGRASKLPCTTQGLQPQSCLQGFQHHAEGAGVFYMPLWRTTRLQISPGDVNPQPCCRVSHRPPRARGAIFSAGHGGNAKAGAVVSTRRGAALLRAAPHALPGTAALQRFPPCRAGLAVCKVSPAVLWNRPQFSTWPVPGPQALAEPCLGSKGSPRPSLALSHGTGCQQLLSEAAEA